MPIKPENKHLYPANWPQIRARILARAGDRCEFCGKFNHQTISQTKAGIWYDKSIGWRDDNGHLVRYNGEYTYSVTVVLTVAHLDHNPSNCDPANLRALCQRCHLRYDAKHHAAEARKTRRARLAVGDLFELKGA
jgi:5-methylcytosine-specific restriction endonuclease McrA